MISKYPLLDKINDPVDLRKFERRDLLPLSIELREFIVESVSTTGGHFSSNLGTIELTIALHYVFNTPDDRLVWDVGHQTYGHKILTGRRTGMPHLRQKGGIAGFPRREESAYDTFGTAHSSTSISAALGMAVAARMAGLKRKSIAIIGDGAITGGMAFEAMNNVGRENVIVILNDNDMSISESIGALNNYLAKLLSGRFCGHQEDRRKSSAAHAHVQGNRQARRRTRQGHDHAFHHVRGIRLQLRRPDRRT